MSFRHYTKLKEIADKYGCDSTGCNTNGALLDRIYESEVTPIDPTGQIDAKIDIQNITARVVRPVEGHNYCGVGTMPVDGWLLEFDNIIGYKDEEGKLYAPVGSGSLVNGSMLCSILFNDVENANSGNIIILTANIEDSTPRGFSDSEIATLKGILPVTLAPPETNYITKLTITEIIDG